MASRIFHGTFIAFAISHVKGFNLPASRIPNSCPTQSGSSCVFPFSYKGVTHYQCTYADSPVPWCATQVSSDGSVVTNMWGDCDMSSTSSCSAESLSISSCTATSGQQCVFPFRYKGVVYTECTSIDQSQPWCSTSVTSSGDHVTGSLGFCPSTCAGAGSSSGGSTGSCTPGTTFTGTCDNTCVCSSAGEPVCTNNPCSTSSTTSTTSSTTSTTSTTTSSTTTASSGSSTTCVTSSGPSTGQNCVFPFTWNGVTHSSCADWIYGGQPAGTRWCSTQVDSNGVHVNGQGFYGFCPSTCTVNVSPQSAQTLSFRSKGASKGAISFGDNKTQPK